jgi:hypothetical protein
MRVILAFVPCRWKDGQYCVMPLNGLDRWEVQAADIIDVSVANVHLTVQQRVRTYIQPPHVTHLSQSPLGEKVDSDYRLPSLLHKPVA